MLFDALNYISPGWYFNLKPQVGDISYFVDYRKLPEASRSLLQFDAGYSSEHSSLLDAAYQAWNKGIIEKHSEMGLAVSEQHPTISDNYRFMRKYFHPIWSWYVLVLRLITLHNPFQEIIGFIRQQKVRRVDLYKDIFPYETAFKAFESPLLQLAPKVSVIIPTLNRYPWLADALKDLETQDYKNFEVIVVDQSEPFQADFYSQFKLEIKLIRQEEKALWLARNTAIQSTNAEYLLLYDDDSRTESNWISEHLKCLDYFQADISSGVSLSVIGAKVPQNYAFYRWSDQLDTGNTMVKRSVFRAVGLFDRQFEKQRQGDGEFGLRAYLAGFKNISNPVAKRIHLKIGEGGLRQMGSWDGWRPKSWWAPRPVPSVLYLIRKYFGLRSALMTLLSNVPPSILPYRFKRKPYLIPLGFFVSLFLAPFIMWKVIQSWRISSSMLRQGASIPRLRSEELKD